MIGAIIAAAATVFWANPLWSTPAGVAIPRNAAPFTLFVGDYGGGGYHSGCGYGYHYMCWRDDYGAKHCGCRHH
jgi:hypothetical protein